MAQGSGGSFFELNFGSDAPTEIRAAIARTRDDLSHHLAALKDRLLRPAASHTPSESTPTPQGDDSVMATKKSAKGSTTSRSKSPAKKSEAAPAAAKGAKSSEAKVKSSKAHPGK